MTDQSLSLVSRGLLELGIDEHKEVVTVKSRLLHEQARLTVYRLGVLASTFDKEQVEIKEYGQVALR
jgi:hypothetical protein